MLGAGYVSSAPVSLMGKEVLFLEFRDHTGGQLVMLAMSLFVSWLYGCIVMREWNKIHGSESTLVPVSLFLGNGFFCSLIFVLVKQ